MSISQYIADEFGSKRGLARYLKFNLLRLTGRYNRAGRRAVAGTTRLIFICSGNICRSPFGEAVSLDAGFPAISFGLHCRGNDPAFEKTLDFAKRHNYPLTEHRSSNMQDYVPQTGDLLIVTEPAHLAVINQQYPDQPAILLGLFASPKTAYLHDPFNTNQVFFDKCMRRIEQATLQLIKVIKK